MTGRVLALLLCATALGACQSTRPAQQAGAATGTPTSSLAQVIGGQGALTQPNGQAPAASPQAALVPQGPAPAGAAAPTPAAAGLQTQISAYQADPAARPATAAGPAPVAVPATAPAAGQASAPANAAPPAASAPVTPVQTGAVATLRDALVAPGSAALVPPPGGPTLPTGSGNVMAPANANPAQTALEPARVPPPRTQTVPLQGLQPDPHVQRAVNNARRPYSEPATPATAPGLSSSDIRRLF
jgi:hypothetical protein